MMYNDWRLIDDIDAYVNRESGIIRFVPIGKKTLRAAYLKGLDDPSIQPISLDSPTFKLRISEDMELFCQEESLGELKVDNFDKSFLGLILTQVHSDKGVMDGEFEVAVSDKLGLVGFVSQEMKEYDGFFDEMVRRMNCQLKKKTTKWIPGHRYDSDNETYYYLGAFKSRKSDPNGSEFLKLNPVELHLVVGHARHFKKISEVFQERVFGSELGDIKVLTKLPSMVDSGEIMEDDIKEGSLQEYYPVLIKNSLGRYVKYNGNLLDYESLYHLFDPFAYGFGDTYPEKDTIESIVYGVMFRSWMTLWDVTAGYAGGKEFEICSGQSEDLNIKNLINNFVRELKDPNALSLMYYPELLEEIGIDLEKIALSVLKQGNPLYMVTKDFESFLKYGDVYFTYHDGTLARRNCNLRDKSYVSTGYGYQKPKSVSIKSVYGDGPLGKELIKIVEEEIESSGLGVKSFSVVNMGTKRDPNEYVKMKITLEDIVKMHPEMPEDLKNDIIDNRFQWMTIEFDKNCSIK